MQAAKYIFSIVFTLGLVCAAVHLISNKVNENVRQNNYYSGYLLQQPILDGRYKRLNIGGKRLYLPRYEQINQGDFIYVGFSTCEFNAEYNSYSNCEVAVDYNRKSWLLSKIFSLRQFIISQITQNLPTPNDYLVLAVTIGYEDDLPDKLTDPLRNIGAIHMLVVSGYNVSLVLNSSSVLLMRFNRWFYLVSSLFLMISFIFITGFAAPIVRAVIMGIFVVISKAYSRPAMSLYLLFLSGLLMISWDFSYLSNISFQLSFSATFGVIISSYFVKTRNFFLSELATSVGASLFVLPILSFYFSTINVLTVVSNLMLGWMVPFITYLGMLNFVFNNLLARAVLIVITDLFLVISEVLNGFSNLNINYQISVAGVIMYYIFLSMFLYFLYRVKLLYE